MAAYLYECAYTLFVKEILLFNHLIAYMDPNSMPGKASFVAGFVQCLYMLIPSLLILANYFLYSQRWRYESEHVRLRAFPFTVSTKY